uniref:N-alpha-acetyltransferase 40 n=1 Tax=Sarcophilus harrisii TaxID=9305 RepID=A0A7N4PAM7_SARHA
MGRKSSKAKEKKQKRLEERAAMDAVCAKVEAANKLEDPLEAFPVFKKYDRNGLNISIECKRVSGLEPATVDWAFDLTKSNMQTLYEQSEWGWKDREKREEMTDDRAWYLIAWEESAVPVAFSHFRFDVECGDEVLYCYEVQLESKVRRKGLGKFLIQILQLVANSTQMKKVMLTVFKHNHGAYQFFREALQFEIDDTSPSMSGCCGDDCSYEILSRRTKFGDSQHAHSDSPAAPQPPSSLRTSTEPELPEPRADPAAQSAPRTGGLEGAPRGAGQGWDPPGKLGRSGLSLRP